MIFVALALSLVIGIALGLLGGGGSILTLPILRYVLHMEAHSAIAVSLLVVGTTSLAALIPHALRRRVRWRTGAIFGVASMTGAFAAGRVAHLFPASVLLVLFGVMMLVTAFAMMRAGRRKGSTPVAPGPVGPHELPVAKVLAEGVAVGAVTGLVGAGGGFLVVPALLLLGHLPMDIAVGTSLMVIAMKSLAGFAGYMGSTEIDFHIAGLVAGFAVVGSFIGGALVTRISPDHLRKAFAWFVVAMAIFILGKELPGVLGQPEEPSPGVVVGAMLGR